MSEDSLERVIGPSSHIRRHGTALVFAIGVASGMLYLLIYLSQQAIYLNGLFQVIAGVVVKGVLANRVSLLWEATVYYVSTFVLFALYACLLLLCRRGWLHSRRTRTLALLFPVLFNLGLLFGRPFFSIDAFSYIAHGYLGITSGSNPYMNAAREAVNLPLGRHLLTWGWKPVHGISPYGPLWTQLEIAVVGLTKDVSLELLLLKSLVVGASLLSAVFIWCILGQVRPKDQLFGTLAYLWNPLIIVEFAAEGHNDAMMIVFVLLSLLLTVRSRPIQALVALVLGVLSKIVPLIFIPAQMFYFWHTQRKSFQLIWQLMLGLMIGLGLAVLLYWPLWIGLRTFQGLQELRAPSVFAFILSLPLAQLSSIIHPTAGKALPWEWPTIILDCLFCCYLLFASLRVHNKKSLLKLCGSIGLVYLYTVSPAYYPWYVTLPLALMVLSPDNAFCWISYMLSLCSRLAAPLFFMAERGFITFMDLVFSTLLLDLLPLITFLLYTWLKRVHRVQKS